MVITKISRQPKGRGTLLTAEALRDQGERGTWPIRLDFASLAPEQLAPGGDPFIPLMLLPAMVLGERLVIEAPVSPTLLRATAGIQRIFAGWVPGAQIISIESQELSPAIGQPSGGVGCFFSGGVDSFYSLLKNEAEITHLIVLGGFDSGSRGKPTVHQELLAKADRLAALRGKGLIAVEIGIRDYTDPIVPWGLYHGSVLASVALALSPILRRVLIPASFAYGQLFPWGTHPLLDPLWSNEATAIIHDGCEVTRAQKVRDWICHSEEALGMLRVCHRNRKSEYNCGVCEKCVRTMIALRAGGGLERCRTFLRPLSPGRVRLLHYVDSYEIGMAEDNLRMLASGTSSERALRRALRGSIRRGRLLLALRGRR